MFNDFVKSLSLGMFHVLRRKKVETKITAPKMTYIGNLKITPPQLVGRRSGFLFGVKKRCSGFRGFSSSTSREYPPPKKKQKTVNLEDAFPFPMVGYATSLEGTSENFPGKGCRSHHVTSRGFTCEKTFYYRWAPDPGYKWSCRTPIISRVITLPSYPLYPAIYRGYITPLITGSKPSFFLPRYLDFSAGILVTLNFFFMFPGAKKFVETNLQMAGVPSVYIFLTFG